MISSVPLRVERRPLSALGAEDRLAWERLLTCSEDGPWAFMSPAYCDAVQACVAPVMLLLCRQAGELVGVMALQRQRAWPGALGLYEPVGGAMTDYFGLLARPGVRTSWPGLLRQGGVACLHFTHLDGAQQRHGLVGEMPRIGLRTRIDPAGGDRHWERLREHDRKLVADTERRERKLHKDHGEIVFHLHSPAPQRDLDALVALKNAQYRRTGHLGGALLQPENADLLARLLATADGPGCRAMLSTLHVGGTLVAAHLGLQAGGTLHYWFPVYDERFAAYSPGRILLRHILFAAPACGIQLIDRGEGDSPAKRDFANESHHYGRGLVHQGVWGWVLSLCQRLAWRWQTSR